MDDYNKEQSEATALVRHHLKMQSSSELARLKRRTRNYLRFREETHQFLQYYFSEVCTQKCYQDRYSACCSREGVTTFFADIVINILLSSDEEIDRLMQVLHLPNVSLKCVYLGKHGCLWRIKPIVCEMFLCEHARKSVLDTNPNARRKWRKLRSREKRYTWPDRPVLFDDIEAYFIRSGYASSLMYLHNSPGLLRVKSQASFFREDRTGAISRIPHD